MKNKIALTIMALGLTLPAITQAQDSGTPPPPRGHRPPPPLIAALDANHDGVIDESEIANASAALKALDKNGDGKLTRDELRPAGPGPKADATGTDNPPPPHKRPAGPDGAGAGPGGPGGPGGGHPPGSPIMGALDANHDGVIDEAEIANASAALKALDKNGDGKLSGDEIHPGGPRGGKGGPNGDRPRKPRPQPSDAPQQ